MHTLPKMIHRVCISRAGEATPRKSDHHPGLRLNIERASASQPSQLATEREHHQIVQRNLGSGGIVLVDLTPFFDL